MTSFLRHNGAMSMPTTAAVTLLECMQRVDVNLPLSGIYGAAHRTQSNSLFLPPFDEAPILVVSLENFVHLYDCQPDLHGSGSAQHRMWLIWVASICKWRMY